MTPYSRFNSTPSVRRGTAAFSLMEILVVLAIIGLLAGLVIANLDNIFGGAQVSTAEVFVKQSMRVPLQTYRMQVGDYPTTAEGLNALISAPPGKADRWRGPYLDNTVPLDPWKHPYQYRYPGTKNKTGYDLFSFGPGGVENEKSIGNW